MMAKRSIETGEGCEAIPEPMRHYLALYFDPNKPGARDPMGRVHGIPVNGMYAHEPPPGKVGEYFPFHQSLILIPTVINHFTCRSLTIGSWRRIGQNSMDLVIFYSPDKACMTYYINNDSAGYKIEYPFSFIKSITLDSGDEGGPQPAGASSTKARTGLGAGLNVELNQPPLFYMDSSNSGGFYQCGDFTEDRQASQVLVHHLGGHPKVLGIQLSKLVSLESFQNRFSPFNSLAMPPPISPAVPFIPRPASQPNHFAAPSFMGAFHDSRMAMEMQQGLRGHKRQRSRSVPAAADFSVMQHLYPPSYSINQAPPPPHFTTDAGIFAPVPMSTHALANNPVRVDTSAPPYSMTYPMSAATAPQSPPDFTSPSLFTAGTPDMAPNNNPFNVPYVDSSDISGHAASPYAAVTPIDSSIANHSPSLVGMPGQPDLFGIGVEQQGSVSEEGMLFPKQNGNFPVSPAVGIGGASFDLPIHGLPNHHSPAAAKGELSSLGNLDDALAQAS